jgi:hypothetical protein
LEENTERLDLASYELSRQRLGEIRQAEADAKREVSEKFSETPRGGRPPKGEVSRDKVREKTGIAPAAQRSIEKHVTVAEQFPVFQRPDWKQYQVLEAAGRRDPAGGSGREAGGE